MASVEKALEAARRAASLSGNASIESEKKLRKGATSDVTPRDRIAEEYYDAITVGDVTSVRIPIVYGEVFHKGISVDSGLQRNTESDRFNDRTLRFIMSEGPCGGVQTPHKYHVVLDQAPVVNPVNQETIMAGVKVKDINTRTTYTEKTTDASFDYQNTVLDSVTSKIHRSLLKNSVAGLDDVAIDQKLTQRHVLYFNETSDRWQSAHISELLKDSGMYISADVSPVLNTYPESGWFLPASTGTFTVTFQENSAYLSRRSGDGPHRWWRAGIFDSPADTYTEQSDPSIKINGIKHPDLTVFRGGTYKFEIDSNKWETSFTSGGTVNTKFYLSVTPEAAQNPDDTSYGRFTGGMSKGEVESLVITNNGSGYTAGDSLTVTLSAPSSGTTATASCVWDGSDWNVTITDAGSGYETAPTVSFSGGSGSSIAGETNITEHYADATRTIIWTVPDNAPDWLWYNVNYKVGIAESLAPSFSNQKHRYPGSRIWVRDA